MCHTFLACLSRAGGSAIEAISLALHSRTSVWHIALRRCSTPTFRSRSLFRRSDSVSLFSRKRLNEILRNLHNRRKITRPTITYSFFFRKRMKKLQTNYHLISVNETMGYHRNLHLKICQYYVFSALLAKSLSEFVQTMQKYTL